MRYGRRGGARPCPPGHRGTRSAGMTYSPLPAFWAAAPPAARDAAYDNTAAVADSATLIAARNAASAAFRVAHGGHLDLPYGTRERQRWDLFPASQPRAPLLVFVHRGYLPRQPPQGF